MTTTKEVIKNSKSTSESFRLWNRMMEDTEEMTVAEDWRNYRSFAKWYNGTSATYRLIENNNDLFIVPNAKVYSPETVLLMSVDDASILRSQFAKMSPPVHECLDKGVWHNEKTSLWVVISGYGLHSNKFRVTTANTGEEAIDKFTRMYPLIKLNMIKALANYGMDRNAIKKIINSEYGQAVRQGMDTEK